MTKKLPYAELVFIDSRKLRDYCLDPLHPRGRHKARVFRAALGLTRDHAAWLEAAIRTGLAEADAVIDSFDHFGVYWRVDLLLGREGRFALVRTVWQVPTHGSVPRLVTCFVLPRNTGA